MELISSDTREVVLGNLCQVKAAIENLLLWNQGITDMNTLLMSPGRMQDLAGNSMTIMAIGEGFRKRLIMQQTDGFWHLGPKSHGDRCLG